MSGATGNALFAVLGLLFSLPLIRRLCRRSGTWKAHAFALGVFAIVFALSAVIIGPAVGGSDADQPDRASVQTPTHDQHEDHHRWPRPSTNLHHT